MPLYKITTYDLEGTVWNKMKSYFYEDTKQFLKQQKQHKVKHTKPIVIDKDPSWKWVNDLLNNNSIGAWSGKYRVVAEEMINGNWTTIDDWIQP